MTKRYIVGIDLGTTNSAVAYVDPADRERRVQSFPIPQLVAEGTVAERPTLPSFLYVGGTHDVGPGALALPWDPGRNYAVGEFARLQGARVPGRLVSSAKSWLCHGGVDREAAILPWGALDDVQKISPVEASARYLLHIREAWRQRFPHAPMDAQDVILTVPASFDEVARELTVAAAELAGLPRVALLEEPQAAFYAWIHEHETAWAEELPDIRLVLVIDIGGGTTDFSLVAVRRTNGGLGFERLAVGDHLLLGGDNIDVALARVLEPRLGARLDSQRWHALTSLCREAKETLLGPEPPAEVPIRLVGRGRSVIGGVLTGSVTREEVEQLVLDGFFPQVAADSLPQRTARAGLQEWGLPFASEPAVPRHLAAFLRQHLSIADCGLRNADSASNPQSAIRNPQFPDALLFNGGALKPPLIRDRLRTLLAEWNHGREPVVLQSADLDLAVGRGAAYYGLVRRGLGVRIGGGSARSYYLGIGPAAGGPADGGPAAGDTDSTTPAPVTALCLVQRGMDEGTEVEITDPALEVVANRAASFPLYASSTRTGERAGQLVTAERDSLTELPPIRTVLRFGKKLSARKLPVHVLARLTEVGTLEVWCRSLVTDHRWRLQFQLRDTARAEEEEPGTAQQAESVISPAQLEAASGALRAVFPPSDTAADGAAGDPIGLVRLLETQMDTGKDAWPLAAIRKLWDVLWEGHQARARSAAHEGRWLNLSGFLLRPGFGAELDDWRIQQIWKIKSAGLRFPKAAQCRAEWWNMWKRVAGGLTRQQQVQLHTEVAPWLLPRLKSRTKGAAKAGPQEIREYWQLMASCERLSAEMKAELGNALLPLIVKGKATDVEIWALGRLGARAPFSGPLNCVVARDTAARWVEELLRVAWSKPDMIVFALVQLARYVGDRERDLDEALRHRLAERLQPLSGGTRAARLVTEFIPFEAQERTRILDESLPAGLRIRSEEDVDREA